MEADEWQECLSQHPRSMRTIERVLRRDYPANLTDELLALIATIEVREKPRVRRRR